MKLLRKIGYAAGDMGVSISYFAVGFYFMFYLTDIVGLNVILAGNVVLIGKFWDGINDPIMGFISDRTKSRFGRKRVYILFGTIPFAISFVLLWLIPGGAATWIQFLLATLAMLLYATTYSLVVVPYMSLVPIMSTDYNERTQITGIRGILSTVGTLLGGGVALFVSGFTEDEFGLRIISIVFAVFTATSLLIAAFSVKGIEEKSEKDTAIFDVSFKQYLKILKQKNVLILMGMKMLGAIATGCLTASLPYFAEWVLEDDGLSSIGLAIYIAVAAALIPLWNQLSYRFDKRRLLMISNSCVGLTLLFIGLFVNSQSIIAFYIGSGILGISMSAYLVLPYSLVPDLVEYYEYKEGERHESVYFGLWMSFHQLGLALAGLILGLFLGAFGYIENSPTQSDSAIQGVRLAFAIIPAIFFILSAALLQWYGITKDVFQKAKDSVFSSKLTE